MPVAEGAGMLSESEPSTVRWPANGTAARQGRPQSVDDFDALARAAVPAWTADLCLRCKPGSSSE